MAEAEGVSSTTVHRWFKLFGLKPHLTRIFKLSKDPFFIEKVRDITGVYLNPPDHAMVLCVDEKSQIQALERSQLPCPWDSRTLKAIRMTIYAMAPRPCLQF